MTAPASAPDITSHDADDDDLVHYWCCDNRVALCGTDLTDAHPNDDPDALICAMCTLVVNDRCGRCGFKP